MRLLVFASCHHQDACLSFVQDVGGEVDTARLWSLVNFGDEPLLLAWPGVRLRLDPGGGCRLNAGLPPGVVPPAEEPTVLLVIRTGPAAGEPGPAASPNVIE